MVADAAGSSNIEKSVAQHYGRTGIEGKLLDALSQAGIDVENLRVDDLAPVDEFHIGGREATAELASQIALEPGMELLDVGCGIGGPARYFAAAHGCKVTAIDLTEAFVAAAQELSRRVKVADRVRFQQGSALDLPFGSASFDRAYLLHVGMNIFDKQTLIAEVKRVLKPGGMFAIYDVMRVGSGEPRYPVPWASAPATSFVAEPAVYREALKSQGFEVIAERERRVYAIEFFKRMQARAAENGGLLNLGTHIVMGADAPEKRANLMEALQRSLLAPVEMIARVKN